MLKESLLKFFKLDGLIDNLTGYVEAKMELLKYEIKEDVAKAASRVALFLVLGAFVTLFVLFISITIALWLSETLGFTAGFAIVAACYLVVASLLILFRKSISHKMEIQVKKALNHKK